MTLRVLVDCSSNPIARRRLEEPEPFSLGPTAATSNAPVDPVTLGFSRVHSAALLAIFTVPLLWLAMRSRPLIRLSLMTARRTCSPSSICGLSS